MSDEVYEGAIGIDLGKLAEKNICLKYGVDTDSASQVQHIPAWLIMRAQMSISVRGSPK